MNDFCEIHPGTPLVSAGPDAVCADCAEEAYEKESGNEQAIFERVRGVLSPDATVRFVAWLDEKKRTGFYPYEAITRAITAHSLSTGSSMEETLAKIAEEKSADFLFVDYSK